MSKEVIEEKIETKDIKEDKPTITADPKPKQKNVSKEKDKKEQASIAPPKAIPAYKTVRYRVIVDLDKDMDILLCCAILNHKGIRAYIERGEVTCGEYSYKINALTVSNDIDACGYKALILEV